MWNYLLITGAVAQAERRRAELQERCLNQNWPVEPSDRDAVRAPCAVGLYLETHVARTQVWPGFVELAQLGAVSSNEMHEAPVNIDVEAFFIARNGLLLPRFSLGRHQHPAG